METRKKGAVFLVLVPHRDARAALQKYYDLLLKKGLKGVYPFPLAAPLAQLSKPLNSDELKQLAKSLRAAAGKEKFYLQKTSATEFDASAQGLMLYGTKIKTEFSFSDCIKNKKILSVFNPPVTGTFLVPKNFENCYAQEFPDELSFRAAAVANMFWQPVNMDGEIIYKWKIGKLYWLPRGNL